MTQNAADAEALIRLNRLNTALEQLEAERNEARADAEQSLAGMREVALFRAANAQACIGELARPLMAQAVYWASRVESSEAP